MSDVDVYSKKRIDKLEDERLDKLCNEVSSIHKILIGNGKRGLIEQVNSNQLKIKLLIWMAAVLFTAIVKTLFN